MTKRKLAAILRESIFDFKKSTGLMKVILEVDDADYYIERAIECVKIAKNATNLKFANEQLTIAISLLALVKCEYEN